MIGQICVYNKAPAPQLDLLWGGLRDNALVLVLALMGTIAVVYSESGVWHVPLEYLGACH